MRLLKCQLSRITHWSFEVLTEKLWQRPGCFPHEQLYSGCDLSYQKQMGLTQIFENMVSGLGVRCAGTAGKALTQLRLSTETP